MVSFSHFIDQFNNKSFRIYFLKQQRASSRYHSRNKLSVADLTDYPQISKKR